MPMVYRAPAIEIMTITLPPSRSAMWNIGITAAQPIIVWMVTDRARRISRSTTFKTIPTTAAVHTAVRLALRHAGSRDTTAIGV